MTKGAVRTRVRTLVLRVGRRLAPDLSTLPPPPIGAPPVPQTPAPETEAPTGKVVRAAGGVIWRKGKSGRIEILLVHRPRYDDWSFPKGKLGKAESHRDGAIREVREETGLRVTMGPELAPAEYIDGRGRPKLVRYWAMTVRGGTFRENREVDRVSWLGPDEVAERLSYAHDLSVLESFFQQIC
jgi:8-oxo-dGTP diphosphatase